MKLKFMCAVFGALMATASAAYSATVEELEARISHIEAVLAQIDADEDFFIPEDGDCNDSDPETHPESDEHSYGDDGKDNDCDGMIDEDDYYDVDSDHDSDSSDDSGHDSYDDSDHDSDSSDDSGHDSDDDDDDECRRWWECW